MVSLSYLVFFFFFFKQKTAYEMRISDWSSDVCSSDLQTSVTIAETAPVVTLNVTETVEAAPDMATVGTGVQTRAQTAAQAMRDNAVQMDRLIAALVKAGIPKKEDRKSDG